MNIAEIDTASVQKWKIDRLRGMSYEQLSRHAADLVKHNHWYVIIDQLLFIRGEMERIKRIAA